MEEPESRPMVSVGYPVSRRAVLAGPVAMAGLAWASRLAGPAAARASRDLGWAGRPVNVRVSRDAFTMHAEPSLAANPRDPRNLLAACMVWQAGQRGLATYVSFDAGGTWHGNGLLPGVTPAYDGDVTAAFDGQGTGYVSGWTGSRAHVQRGRVRVWRTVIGGQTFASPVFVTHVTPPPKIGGVNDTTGGPVITASGQALHLAVATVTTAPASELLLFTSRDHGRTWTEPLTVARSATTVYFQPQLAADPAGRIALSAFALPLRTGRVSVELFISQPHSTRFGPPVTVTTRPFNPHAGTQQGWIGDYQGLTATPSAFHPLWNDTRTGRLQIFTASIKPG